MIVRSQPSARARPAVPAAVVAMTLALTACSSSAGPGPSADSTSGAQQDPTEGPIVLDVCGTEHELTGQAERVVSLTQPQTDLMIELGAADRLVAVAGSAEPGELPGSALHGIGEVQHAEDLGNGVPSREVTIAQEAQLVLGATVSEFDNSSGAASMEDLTAAGAVPYLAAAGCPDHRLERSVYDVLIDVEQLGVAVGERERAEQVAADYRARVDAVIETTSGAEPVRVVELFIFGDSIEVYAASSEQDLIHAAGGENVFTADDPAFDGGLFASLSTEVIAAAEPEAFVFSVSGQEEADAAAQTLRERFPTTPAVQNDLIVAYASNASLPGSLGMAEALEHVARSLHPDRF